MKASQNKNKTNTSTPERFYFLVDYNKTKAAVKAKIDMYNHDLQLQYINNPSEFRKNKGLTAKQTYKACTIKSTEETTLFSLIQIYGGWLHRNSYTGLVPEEFRTNNKALCTQKNGHITTRTVQRHLNALMECGLITSKSFRGTKASFGIFLNPDLIHFKPNQAYNFWLTELYKQQLGSVEVNPLAFAQTLSFSGTLRDFPLGYEATNCRLNSTSILLLVHKINMESGIVSLNFSSPQAFSKNSTNNIFEIFNKNNESQKVCQNLNAPHVAPPPPPAPPQDKFAAELNHEQLQQQAITKEVARAEKRKNNHNPNLSKNEQLWIETLKFYAYSIAILWPERLITQYERNVICLNIYKHFKNKVGEHPVYPTIYTFRGDFMFRILLTKKYCNNNPLWQLQSPTTYFNIDSKSGFNGTSAWAKRSKLMESENKLYLEHYKKFIRGWKFYSSNPNIESYNKVIQYLGKLKADVWKNYFNASVANLSKINTSEFKQIYQQHYNV